MTLPPRLRAVVDASLQYRITEIVAPAGFGKSTVIDYLARSHGFAIARVRPGEEPSLALMQALCDSMADEEPELRRTLSTAYMNASSSERTPELARWFLEWLPHRDAAIALDDLHHLGEDAISWRLLRDVIELTGTKTRWILASRTWLHLPTVHWVASGNQGPAIQQSDLGLVPDDVRSVAEMLRINVSSEIAREIIEATHGWPLLVMYCLRLLAGNQGSRAIMAAVSGRGAEAVVERILSDLESDQQRLLVAIALYDGAAPEMLERTHPGAVSTLGRLISNGVPLFQGNDRRWRLHDVLREPVLQRHRMLRISEAESICRKLEAMENLEPALAVAMASESLDLVRSLLEKHVNYFLFAGNFQAVQRAVASFPQRTIHESAKLTLFRGTIEMKLGHAAVGVAFLRRAVELSKDSEKSYAIARLGIGLTNWQGHALEGFAAFREASRTPMPEKPDDRCEVLATVAVGLALAGDTPGALSHVEKAIDLLPALDAPLVEARVYMRAGQVALMASLVQQAEEHFIRSISISEEYGFLDVLVIACDWAKVTCSYNREAVAIEYAQKAATYAAKTLDRAMLYMERASLFVYACKAGNLDEARALKKVLIPIPEQWRPRFEAVVLMTDAHLSMLDGNFDEAGAVLAQITCFGEAAMNPELIPQRESMYYCYHAVLLQLRGMTENAVSNAKRALSMVSEIQLDGFGLTGTPEIEITKICAAAILAFNGRVSESQPILDDMAANAHERYRRDLARWVSELIGDPNAEPSTEARTRANGIIVLLQRCASGVETATLTPAERRVLEALAQGYSTKEIAAMTGRSSKTVTNQITSLLRKLQARSRGEAVARAHRRGLLTTEEPYRGTVATLPLQSIRAPR